MKLRLNHLLTLTLLAGWLIPFTAVSQEDEKPTVRISLSYFWDSDQGSYCKVLVRTREGRRYQPVEGVIINLFLDEETKSGMMGNITTDEEGTGIYVMPDKYEAAFDTLQEINLIARLLNDPNYQDKSEMITITKSRLELNTNPDTTITSRIYAYSEEGMVPQEDVEIKFYVKRMFSNLPFGEEFLTTDENGEITLSFPKDLPGDKDGKLTIIAKVEDHDEFGNLSTNLDVNWGVPLKEDHSFDERTLWATRDKAPYWLLIVPNLIILGVWGTLIFLVLQLYKIYKIGQENN